MTHGKTWVEFYPAFGLHGCRCEPTIVQRTLPCRADPQMGLKDRIDRFKTPVLFIAGNCLNELDGAYFNTNRANAQDYMFWASSTAPLVSEHSPGGTKALHMTLPKPSSA